MQQHYRWQSLEPFTVLHPKLLELFVYMAWQDMVLGLTFQHLSCPYSKAPALPADTFFSHWNHVVITQSVCTSQFLFLSTTNGQPPSGLTRLCCSEGGVRNLPRPCAVCPRAGSNHCLKSRNILPGLSWMQKWCVAGENMSSTSHMCRRDYVISLKNTSQMAVWIELSLQPQALSEMFSWTLRLLKYFEGPYFICFPSS